MEIIAALAIAAFAIAVLTLSLLSSSIKKATKDVTEVINTQNKVLAGRLDEMAKNHAQLARAVEELEQGTVKEFARTKSELARLEQRDEDREKELAGIRARLHELGGGVTKQPISSA